ncbi:hypothetical protein BCU66_020640 [Vibrio sp. 10N.286.49.B1]|uniref:hypothetical protein n=1 Tax=unclassified Vibrio TaxID=2614977 RepID=UPI0010554D8A|nr:MULTISPECIES: hypothetical protein [unclassified Vibrio]
MYKFVKNKLDTLYSQLPSSDLELNHGDVPVEEIEVREMLSAWYDTAYQPVVTATSEEEIKTAKLRLNKLEATILVVLKNRVYQAAFERILTTQLESASKERLVMLLNQSKNRCAMH